MIGQQAVCIHDYSLDGPESYGNMLPTCGVIYTVRDVIVDPVDWRFGYHLEEIVNERRPCQPDGRLGEMAFPVEHFIPIAKPKVHGFLTTSGLM